MCSSGGFFPFKSTLFNRATKDKTNYLSQSDQYKLVDHASSTHTIITQTNVVKSGCGVCPLKSAFNTLPVALIKETPSASEVVILEVLLRLGGGRAWTGKGVLLVDASPSAGRL